MLPPIVGMNTLLPELAPHRLPIMWHLIYVTQVRIDMKQSADHRPGHATKLDELGVGHRHSLLQSLGVRHLTSDAIDCGRS